MHQTIKVLLCAALAAAVTAGCASGPGGPGSGGAGLPPGTAPQHLVTFQMTINPSGTIDRSGRGYYVFLLNANGDPIEVSNLDTFTDMVRFDGTNFSWFHRVEGVPAPGFFLVFTSNVNDNARISGDQRSLQVTFNDGDASNPFNQFILGERFTAHALTSDSLNSAVRGRIIDTIGQGPSLDGNENFTLTVDKLVGAVSPLPPNFPTDAANDFITYPDLPPDFPYVNFDITSFDVTEQTIQ